MPNRPLSDFCSLIADSEHKTAPKDPGGAHPLIRTTDLGSARVDWTAAQRVNDDAYARWTRRARPQHGDLILAREAPIGGVGRVPPNVTPVLGQRTVLIRPRQTESDSRFLMYRLAASDMQARMTEMATGATVPHLNMADIRTLAIPDVPSVKEQRRRATLLSAFDELIEINERRIELLEGLARSLYREWFVRFRFAANHGKSLRESELGPIPATWTTCRLGDIVTLRYGKALPAKKRISGPFPVVSSAGVVDEHQEWLVEAPGVVVGRKGNVGSVWWIDRSFFPIDTTYYVETEAPLGLVYWQLRDLAFVDSHAAVPGLSRDQAYSLPVLVPEAAASTQFDRVHRVCFDAMAQLREHNRALAEVRDLLLPRLVTGRLDISDLDLEELLHEEGVA